MRPLLAAEVNTSAVRRRKGAPATYAIHSKADIRLQCNICRDGPILLSPVSLTRIARALFVVLLRSERGIYAAQLTIF